MNTTQSVVTASPSPSPYEQLQTLYAVNDMLRRVEADGLNLDTIIPGVLELAVKELNADDGSIIIVNQQKKIEHAWLTSTSSQELLDDIMEFGVAGWVIRNQAPLIIDDTRTDKRWLPNPDHTTSTEAWSVVCLPFVSRERTVGAITIHKKGAQQLSASEQDLLTIIASQTASTIENARLYQKTQRQLQVSNLLNEASKVINSSLDINEIMQSLLAQMNDLLNAEALSIALVDEPTHELVYRVAEGIGSEQIVGLRLPSSQGLSGWVMENGQPALVTDTQHDPRFNRDGDERTGYPTQAMMCAPLQFKGDVLGTIQAINPIKGMFTEDDLDLLVNLANIASSAIAHAQQFAQTQAAEERYTRLFEDSIDAILLTDMEGYVAEANNQASAFFKYDRAELLGMSLSYIHSSEFALPTAEQLSAEKLKPFESEVLTKEGVKIPVAVYAKRTTFGEHELLQWIYHDTTEQHQLEEMRQDFISMLFHDLQSPLGNVITSLDLLTDEIDKEKEPILWSMLSIAIRSSQQLRTLIKSLLDISRLEANQPLSDASEVSLTDIMAEVIDMKASNLAKRDVALVVDVPADLPPIYAEADMIMRVFINLIDNGVKYGQGGREIRVNGRLADDANMLLLSVSDQGPGVPSEHRHTIFNKFNRIQKMDTQGNKQKGLGLGLAFCKLAVQAHGGNIWVDDAPTGGARFNFTLPVYQAKLHADA